MEKYKYLLKNFGLMTISNFASKILSFILVPLYTSVLTTNEYGIYELYITTIFLIAPILSANIIDAALRFLLEEGSDPKAIFTVVTRKYILASVILVFIVAINNYFKIVNIFIDYSVYFVIYFIVSFFSDFMIQFSRGLEKIFDVAIAGIISSILMLTLNIVFLVKFKMRLEGYFLANILALFISAFYLFFRSRCWQYLNVRGCYKKEKKDMVKYSFPLVFNNIGWWINNISDRYIITFMCGVAENGIYSIAYKIPSMLTLIQTIFNQAWTISAVKEYKKNNDKFYTEIYFIYNLVIVIICSILIVFNKFIAKILFHNDFYNAWRYAPFLIISVLFSSLSSLLGGIFSATKRSDLLGKTTILGAIINIFFNFILIYFIGSIGAAVSTMISYCFVFVIRLYFVNKFVKIEENYLKNAISYIILCIQAIIMLVIVDNIYLYVVEIGCLIFIILIYFKDIFKLIKIGKSLLLKKFK